MPATKETAPNKLHSTGIISNGREFISEVLNPPARYRVSIYGETEWFHSGSDAAEAVSGLAHDYWSLYDEWAGRFVSMGAAICGFPRINASK